MQTLDKNKIMDEVKELTKKEKISFEEYIESRLKLIDLKFQNLQEWRDKLHDHLEERDALQKQRYEEISEAFNELTEAFNLLMKDELTQAINELKRAIDANT